MDKNYNYVKKNTVLENYLLNFDSYNKKIVYYFKIGWGGIGDFIKFYIYLLDYCIKNKYKLYLLKDEITFINFLELIENKLYITHEKIKGNIFRVKNLNKALTYNTDKYILIYPGMFYKLSNLYTFDDFSIFDNINKDIFNIFKFNDCIKLNKNNILPSHIKKYESIHLRLGDKFLETNKKYIQIKDDERDFNEENLFNYIKNKKNENIIFFCDNNQYKLKIKEKFNNIIILNTKIGHTSLKNTEEKQILDTLTEFYILVNSTRICTPNKKNRPSGFSIMASKFKGIDYIFI